jgi:hypothetical protein
MKPCNTFICTLLLAVTLGVGQEGTAQRTPQQTPNINKTTSQNLTPATTPQPKKTKKELWPRTFIPSEKITADSVVSFPADI